MEEKFELEVLTRLAVIESKIDDYKLIKEKLYKPKNTIPILPPYIIAVYPAK